ncbi:MAG: hypothetical protein IPP81_14700 [Chitinophagaceae bacterium]|nr:hypothetical protein [Chitinophagaceae bacterium]
MNDNTKIAGSKNIGQWRVLRQKLIDDPANNENWEEAFNDFLLARINARYFDPIEAITKIKAKEGKGFSIVAIYSSLIEFFETLKKGYDFQQPHYLDKTGNMVRSLVNLDPIGVGQPLSNREVFVNFLSENLPFNAVFSVMLAESFYFNVRCSILHQAETHSNWFIKEGNASDAILQINIDETILRWKPLKEAFGNYLNVTYKNTLLADKLTKTNFIFKWDKICEI